jgi:carbonic anhydrase/acetyltransferase-like protein (isoleucine patch superfamily)
MIYDYQGTYPDTGAGAFIAESADIAGAVTVGKDASIWFNVSIRADLAEIAIGDRSNIQDNAIVHVDKGKQVVIGSGVTIGHGAIIHSCTIGDDCLIGMGAIIMNGSVIGEESIVGAGALITENKTFPARSLIIGSPAKAVRTLTEEEIEAIKENCREYVALAEKYHRKEREN